MFNQDDMKALKEANEKYRQGKLRIGKLAYKAMREAIRQIEDIETADIKIPWTSGIKVDDDYFTQEELKNE